MSLNVLSTTPVATGDDIYVELLLNAGWRWDTFSTTGDTNAIRWNVDDTYATTDVRNWW